MRSPSKKSRHGRLKSESRSKSELDKLIDAQRELGESKGTPVVKSQPTPKISNNLFIEDDRTASEAKVVPINATEEHLPQHIASVVNGLESLVETLPAVLQVANGWAPAGIAFRNRDLLTSAINMLRSYERMRSAEADKLFAQYQQREAVRAEESLAKATAAGIALGIEQEKQRVKEARRGRNKH